MSWKFELLLKPETEQNITEGPVWDGEHIYITHIMKNRILRYDPAT
jgi:sugar lactone lactonase YvrE